MRFSGEWSSKEDVCNDFRIADFDGVVLLAHYECESYEGSANVLFMNEGKLFHVYGGHCSCYGLEDQWEPDEITIEMILHMAENGNGFWAQNSWIAEALRTIRDRKLADDPDEVLAVLMLLS